ncbi:MAG: hypothetical protein QNJ73_08775 [Gammaproteobacteria bacterium]|nr:hypothetical protein [Gammaproteobacteria bacterium]
MRTCHRSWLTWALVLSLTPILGWSHGEVDRVTEAKPGHIRILTADAGSGEIITLDLPDGEVVSRIQAPRYTITIGLSSDHQHLYVLRGRSTDRDWVTVINTGVTPASNEIRPPFVARTLPAEAASGPFHNVMPTIGGKDFLFMEDSAEMVVMEDENFATYDPVPVTRYQLAAPDHYFYIETEENFYIGHLRRGFVQVLSKETGAEVIRIRGCPALHGKAKDPVTGRLFFACDPNIMVVGTRGDEINTVLTRINYPGDLRVGAFLKGKGRVLWGFTEGTVPIVYRFDTATEPYVLTPVSVGASVRQEVTEDGGLLLSLTRGGVLQIRDGDSGKLLRAAVIADPFTQSLHEMTDKAVLPDIGTLGDRAFVTLPHQGRIAEVDLTAGELVRHYDIGGSPTRLVVIPVTGEVNLAGTTPAAARN